MLEPSTASQIARSEDTDDCTSNSPSKKRGNLAATLDRELEARLPPGKPGRPKGTNNYEWTPETDSFSSSCAREAALQRRNASLDAESRRTGRQERRPDLTAFVKRLNAAWRNWESAPGRSEANRTQEKSSPGRSVR